MLKASNVPRTNLNANLFSRWHHGTAKKNSMEEDRIMVLNMNGAEGLTLPDLCKKRVGAADYLGVVFLLAALKLLSIVLGKSSFNFFLFFIKPWIEVTAGIREDLAPEIV
jgi:hypothetical protein